MQSSLQNMSGTQGSRRELKQAEKRYDEQNVSNGRAHIEGEGNAQAPDPQSCARKEFMSASAEADFTATKVV